MWTITSSQDSDSAVSSLRILMPLISLTCFTASVTTSQIARSAVLLGSPAHSWLGRLASRPAAFVTMFAVSCYCIPTSGPALQRVCCCCLKSKGISENTENHLTFLL